MLENHNHEILPNQQGFLQTQQNHNNHDHHHDPHSNDLSRLEEEKFRNHNPNDQS